MRHLVRTLLLMLCGLAGCAEKDDEQLGGPAVDSGPRVNYSVLFEGDMPDGLESYLRSVSNAANLTGQPPSSELILRRRAEADIPRLEQGLRARGFYEGKVSFAIRQLREEQAGGDRKDPNGLETLDQWIEGPAVAIVYTVSPGPVFMFDHRSVSVEGGGMAAEFTPPKPAELGLKQEEPAESDKIIDAGNALLRRAQEQGFAFAKLGDRDLVVDYDRQIMDVGLTITPGDRYDFAEPVIEGVESIDPAYVRGRILFHQEQQYDIRLVEEGRKRLIDTKLFATVRIRQGKAPDENGEVPVTYLVTERKQRTVGVGAGYLSEDGPNVRLFAEDRNLLGAGETLRGEIQLSEPLRQLTVRFRKPDVLIPDLDFLVQSTVKEENTDAFDSKSIGAGAGLEYDVNEHLIVSGGLGYRYAEIDDDEDDERIGLLFVPLSAELDYSNSPLDPTTGWRLFLQGAPYWDTLGAGTQFNKIQLTHTRYFTLQNHPRTVLALRAGTGTIVGADRDEIPADERFYAGGGGSVRGIGFQLAGPLDDKDDPIGGRSLVELSAELRYMVIDNVELATFYDAGTVYDSTTPDFDHDLESGVGVGVRYISAVGPIRIDFAVPVDRRKGVDDPYQFYISIGQAF